MFTDYAKLCVFAAASVAPMAALCAGSVDPYGSPHPPVPELVQFADEKPGAFDALGEALLHRSWVTREAVTLKNTLAYRVFRHVDTDKVMSGRKLWLFYRPELGGQHCLVEEATRRLARGVASLVDLAEASRIRAIVGISPDKSVIYPEMLAPKFQPFYRCKARDASTLRSAFSEEAPGFLDHAVDLLAEKQRHPERRLYFATDTHWTPYGRALALRQLVTQLFPELAPFPEPRMLAEQTETMTDIRNGMLRMSMLERFHPLDEAQETAFSAHVGSHPERVVMLHDSFYGGLEASLRRIFPNLKLVHQDLTESLSAALADADLLLVNSAERMFLPRTTHAATSVEGALAQALLLRNQALAEGCVFAPGQDTASLLSDLNDLAETEGQFVPSGGDPHFVVRLPETAGAAQHCLRLRLSTPVDTMLELFLPRPTGGRLRFQAGRFIHVPIAAGEQTLTLALPHRASGLGVRLDLGDAPGPQARVIMLEVGTIPTPAARALP
jgi:hypothetical protein